MAGAGGATWGGAASLGWGVEVDESDCAAIFVGAGRSTAGVRVEREDEVTKAGVRTGVVCGRAAGVVGGGWSAGRVTVPLRLKSCSPAGPTVSIAGVFVVVCDGTAWASATEGVSHAAPASNIGNTRKFALIRSRS
jgi:hypothetical protein